MLRALRITGALLLLALGLTVAACGSDDESSSTATAAGTGTGTAAQPAASGEKKKVSLMLDFFHSETHSGFFAAQDQGFYEEAGLDVDIKPGQGSSVTVQQVAEGNEDFGWANATALIQLASKGADVKAIGSMRQLNDGGIIYWPSRGISQPKDLEGKTCAMTAAGFVTLLLPEWAENVGVDADKIKKRVLDASAGNALFGSGRADCLEGTAGTLYFFKPQDGKPAEIFRYSDGDLNTLGFTLITRNDKVSNDAETVRKFTQATIKGWEWACENPEEAVAGARKHMDEPTYDEETGVKIWKLACELAHTPNTEGDPLGYMAPEDWESTIEILKSNPKLEVKNPPPAEELFTNEFVEVQAP